MSGRLVGPEERLDREREAHTRADAERVVREVAQGWRAAPREVDELLGDPRRRARAHACDGARPHRRVERGGGGPRRVGDDEGRPEVRELVGARELARVELPREGEREDEGAQKRSAPEPATSRTMIVFVRSSTVTVPRGESSGFTLSAISFALA